MTCSKRKTQGTFEEALKSDIEKLSGLSDIDNRVYGLKLAIYIFSNNLCAPMQAKRLLEWLLDTIDDSMFEILLSINLPTMDAFVQNFSKAALKSKNIHALQTLAEVGINSRPLLKCLKQHIKEIVMIGDVKLVRDLLKTDSSLLEVESDNHDDDPKNCSKEAC